MSAKRIRIFLRNVWEFYASIFRGGLKLLKNVRQKGKSPERIKKTSKKVKFRSGWVFFAIILFGGICAIFYKPPFGFAVAGLSFIYLAFCFYEIKAPDIAFLFRMGKLVGNLDPGWYVAIPHLWHIETIPTSWLQVNMEGDMYVARKTPIRVHARVKFRVNGKKLDKVLLMLPEEMQKRAEIIGLSVLRGGVGSSPFETLVTDKGALETEMEKLLKKEFIEHGYIFGDLKVWDFDEQVQSKAEEIKILGEARGEAMKAMATPLKDNLPAALSNVAITITESIMAIFGAGKKVKTAPVEKITAESIADELGKKIENLIKKVA